MINHDAALWHDASNNAYAALTAEQGGQGCFYTSPIVVSPIQSIRKTAEASK